MMRARRTRPDDISTKKAARDKADRRVKRKSKARRQKSMMRKKYRAMPGMDYASDSDNDSG